MNDLRVMDAERAKICPWRDKCVAVILVADGIFTYANTLTDKRHLVNDMYTDECTLLVAWPGAWSQDVFICDQAVLAKALAAPE